MVITRAAFACLAAGLAGCGSFEDPNVVIDLRVLAMAASPPDQVIDVDLREQPTPDELLAALVPIEVCVLVADPGADRRLAWSMSACLLGRGERCDDDLPAIAMGSGVIDDPDLTTPAPALCGTLTPTLGLLAVFSRVLDDDTLRGLGGIDIGAVLQIGGEDADRTLDDYATKTLRVLPRIPETRTANTNPTIDRIDVTVDEAEPVPLPLGRCLDQPTPFELPAGVRVRLTPVEAEGTREAYVIPTLDGKSQTFTESPTYQWVAGAGGFSSGSTGGPRDVSGNPAPLFSDYRAPDPADIAVPTDVPLWIIQRDERLGLRWYDACVRVMPAPR